MSLGSYKELDDGSVENVFCRYFKLNVPRMIDFEYYFGLCCNEDMIKDFEVVKSDYERRTEEERSGLFYYEQDAVYMRKIVEFVKGSKVYQRVVDYGREKNGLRKGVLRKRHYREHDGQLLLSIDQRQANYSVLKVFDEDNELPEDWEGLCGLLEIPDLWTRSKIFRQYVFNAGKIANAELSLIECLIGMEILDALVSNGVIQYYGSSKDVNQVVFVGTDEIVISIESTQVVNKVKSILTENEGTGKYNLNYSVLIMNEIDSKKGVFLQNCYENDVLITQKLVGAPKNLFYMYLKHYIKKSEIEDRDTYFIVDDNIAKWDIDTWIEKQSDKI